VQETSAIPELRKENPELQAKLGYLVRLYHKEIKITNDKLTQERNITHTHIRLCIKQILTEFGDPCLIVQLIRRQRLGKLCFKVI
jgi:hypothetical protein